MCRCSWARVWEIFCWSTLTPCLLTARAWSGACEKNRKKVKKTSKRLRLVGELSTPPTTNPTLSTIFQRTHESGVRATTSAIAPSRGPAGAPGSRSSGTSRSVRGGFTDGQRAQNVCRGGGVTLVAKQKKKKNCGKAAQQQAAQQASTVKSERLNRKPLARRRQTYDTA